MAVIQYTAVVNQIRGKLNGSVFNRSRNGYTLQRKQQPTRAVKGIQPLRRNQFSEVQRAWKALSPSQKGSWAAAAAANPAFDRFGQQTVLSGYNQYIKCNMFRVAASLPLLSVAPSGTAEGVDITLSFTNTRFWELTPAGDIQVTWEQSVEVSEARPELHAFFDLSLPVSAGVTAYYGTWYLIGTAPLSTSLNFTGIKNMGTRFPFPFENAAMYQRMRIIDITRGAVVAEITETSFALV